MATKSRLAATSLLLVAAIVAIVGLAANSPRTSAHSGASEWVNPGAPHWPAEMQRDWFERGSADATKVASIRAVAGKAGYGFRPAFRS